MESPRRGRDPIEEVLKEAAGLERRLFEPAVDAVVEHLFKGASPTVAKKARRTALEAADKKHAELNIAAMRATLNEEEEDLRLWSQRQLLRARLSFCVLSTP